MNFIYFNNQDDNDNLFQQKFKKKKHLFIKKIQIILFLLKVMSKMKFVLLACFFLFNNYFINSKAVLRKSKYENAILLSDDGN